MNDPTYLDLADRLITYANYASGLAENIKADLNDMHLVEDPDTHSDVLHEIQNTLIKAMAQVQAMHAELKGDQ